MTKKHMTENHGGGVQRKQHKSYCDNQNTKAKGEHDS